MGFRTNIQTIVKTFRFPPELVEDMERVLRLAYDNDGKPKYKYMTVLVITAIRELIKKERRLLEDEGVAWDHLGSNSNNQSKELSND